MDSEVGCGFVLLQSPVLDTIISEESHSCGQEDSKPEHRGCMRGGNTVGDCSQLYEVADPQVPNVYKDTQEDAEEPVDACPVSGPNHNVEGYHSVHAGEAGNRQAPNISILTVFKQTSMLLEHPHGNEVDNQGVYDSQTAVTQVILLIEDGRSLPNIVQEWV